ncbi:MAG: tetratricopeptide (TPR) repeat protein, partial [Halieaceae bacterium]
MNKLILLIFILIISLPNLAFDNNSDSLKSELASCRNPKKKAILLMELAYLEKYDNLEEAKSVTKINLEILKELGDQEGIAIGKSYLGVYYYLENQFPKAIKYLKEAEKIFIETKNNERLDKVYNNLGISYSSLYDYNSAITYFHKVLELKQQGSNFPEIDKNLINISTIYYSQGKYEKCIETNERALILTLQKNDHEATALVYSNLGAAHERLGNYKKSVNYALKALDLYQNEVPNTLSEIRTYTNLGSTYMSQGLLDEANYYFNLTLDLISGSKYVKQKIVVLNNLSELKRKTGEINAATILVKKALFLADSTTNNEEKLISLETLSNIEQDAESFKNALTHYKQYIFLSDSLMAVSNFQKTDLALAQHELAIENVKQEKDNNQLLLIQKKLKTITYFTYILAGLLALWITCLIFNLKLPLFAIKLSSFIFSFSLIGA